MKNITSRLKDIEDRITKNHGTEFESILKIERWKFDIGPKDLITIPEWEEYKKKEMELSKDKKKSEIEIKELEDKIRSNNGFIELIFYGDDGRVLGHVF